MSSETARATFNASLRYLGRGHERSLTYAAASEESESRNLGGHSCEIAEQWSYDGSAFSPRFWRERGPNPRRGPDQVWTTKKGPPR